MTTSPESVSCVSCSTNVAATTTLASCLSIGSNTAGFTCESPSCTHQLCKACFHQRPLLVGATDNDLNTGTIQRLCPSCFRSKSTVDYSRTYEYVPPATTGAKTSNNDTTLDASTIFVFVHGASGSRCMFRPHAERLHQEYGHGYVLVDLPGHASLLETSQDDASQQPPALTLETCRITTQRVLQECGLITVDDDAKCKKQQQHKLIYVGGSLGAYVGFYVLHQLAPLFDGAILMDCGQNVGPDRGMAARVGLVFLRMMAEHSSNYSLMKMMLQVSQKSPADYALVDSVFGAGIWFDAAAAHVDCLRAVHPVEELSGCTCPILYLNGSQDHRDSEQRWLEHSPPGSSLHVYEGGDHFFTHDSRFVEDMLGRMDEFQQKLFEK